MADTKISVQNTYIVTDVLNNKGVKKKIREREKKKNHKIWNKFTNQAVENDIFNSITMTLTRVFKSQLYRLYGCK